MIMNRRILFQLLLIVASVFVHLSALAGNDVRIMSYNVRNCIGIDNKLDFDRIASIINNASPDVVALQEIDSMTNRSGKRFVLQEIADRTDMKAFFSPAISFDGGKYGVGILSKEEPISIKCVPLPGREEERTFLMAEFAQYIFCCTHLSLTEADRMASLSVINELSKTSRKPFFIAGDFNALPQSDFINGLKERFNFVSNIRQHTFPSSGPNETIDYILSLKSADIKTCVLSSKVIDDSIASDHRPVMSVVRIASPAEKIISTQPYLQNPVGNGITVMWETSVPSYSWVEYGTDADNLKMARTLINGQADCNTTIHKVRLSDIIPGKKYYYRVCSAEILKYQAYSKSFGDTVYTDISSFVLPDLESSDFSAVIFNDLHKQYKTFNALCDVVKNVDYDFVIFNGDCIDDPSGREEASAFIRELTSKVRANQIPVFFMRGNHEIRNAYSVELSKHFDYVGGTTYSAFNWGDTRFVMLDCGEDKPDNHWVYYGLNDFSQFREEQVEFLKKELSSKNFRKASKRILMHHIPMYGNDGKNLCYEIWHPVLRKAAFDVSINAHTHRFNYIPKNNSDNNFPVIIGGGYSMDDATVIVLNKHDDELNVKVYDVNGKVLLDENY